MSADLIELPAYGPKMLALRTDKQRAFVAALFSEEAPEKGDGLYVFAAREAGYGNAERTTTNKAFGVIAARLKQDPHVREAIDEYARVALRTLSPEAVAALKQLLRDPKHRDHMRAIAAIADRVAPIEHTVTVQHRAPAELEQATQQVLARIHELAQRAGVPPTIDAEFTVVSESAAQ